jgi:ATP-dependent Clp protease protease subunit
MMKIAKLVTLAGVTLCLTTAVHAENIKLTDRMVQLSGGISSKLINKATTKLLALEGESNDPIWLMIDSYGGSVDAGYILIDTIKGMKSPVYAVVVSKAYSMAAIITAYCAKRYIYPHATMMFHEASYGAIGEDPSIRSRVEFNVRYLDRIHLELAKILKLPTKKYRERIRDAWWVLAQEAVNANMVDAIVTGVSYRKLPISTTEIKRTTTVKQKRSYRIGDGPGAKPIDTPSK